MRIQAVVSFVVPLVASFVALAACGSKKGDGPSGGAAAGGSAGSAAAAAGSGEAAAGSGAGEAKPGYCVTSDADNVLTAFVADDRTATFCLGKEGDEKVAPRCTAVDLATGAYSAAAAAPAAPAAPPAALAIKQDARGVEACKGAACKKLDLPAPKADDGEVAGYRIAVSSDGKRVAATGGALPGVVLLDGATGKRLKELKLGGDGTCIEGASFVGDSVYVATSNCAGPGGGAVLYAAAGQKLGDVATEETINAYGAEPLHVGGDHWAIVGYGGGEVLVFDARTGKQVHIIDVQPPEDCEQCGEVLGTAAQWTASPIAKLPSGKLATLDGTGVSIIDPAAGKVEKTHRMPICAATK